MNGPHQWEIAEMACTILSPGARQILRYWVRSPEFLDDNRHPVVLGTANSQVGEQWAFQCLVRAANPAAAPMAILNELQRKEIVEMLDNGQVFLRRSAYMISHPQFKSEPYEHNALMPDATLPCRRYNDAI
jgi:hypothetical protein